MHSNSQILMNSKIKMQSIAYMDGFRTQGVVAEPFFVLLFFGAGKKGVGGGMKISVGEEEGMKKSFRGSGGDETWVRVCVCVGGGLL